MRTALIDADSIIYIVAWNHKDSEDFMVLQAVDSIVKAILEKTQVSHYVGFLSGTGRNFRRDVYKFAVYKGNRGEKPEWVQKWEPLIRQHLSMVWQFKQFEFAEADDCMGCYPLAHPLEDFVFCSPDKDIRQIPGRHFDYKKMDGEILTVSEIEGVRNLGMLMLCGDVTDNIKGLPGIGEVKAKKILDALTDPVDIELEVQRLYLNFFGEYYGPIIWGETRKTAGLNHLWLLSSEFKDFIEGLSPLPVPDLDFDLPQL